MELIKQMAENQKVQEVKLDELKNSVGRLQEELESARTGKSKAECLLKEAQDEIRDIEDRYNTLLEESKTAKETYTREMNIAKNHWNTVELELKTTYEGMVGEMRRLENKNFELQDEIREISERWILSKENENFLTMDLEKWKKLAEDNDKNRSDLQMENEKNCEELHNCKMQLLKERNINDRLLDEIRRQKKELEIRSQQVEEAKKDKESLSLRVEELVHVASNERLLEIELKELKMSTNMILLGNNSIEDKIATLGRMLRGETATASVQTDMTHSDLDQYENLDRQATLLVMGLKEQLLSLKQQYLDSRQENDVLKGFVQEVKQEREAKEEGERVGRLEETVKSLSDMVRQELYEPSRESCILQALQDVKNDLNTLKARSRINKNQKPSRDVPEITPIMRNQTFDPANRPVKLVTFRNIHP